MITFYDGLFTETLEIMKEAHDCADILRDLDRIGQAKTNVSNDNISEILGGRFKVLGKVIAICKDDSENIDLFRKTTLSILSDDILSEALSAFQNEDSKQFNLPTLNTKIYGPAVIVIPIAIYA